MSAAFLLFLPKLRNARLTGVILLCFLSLFRTAPPVDTSLILTASTGDTEEAIFNGVRIEIITAVSVSTAITAMQGMEILHFHPSGSSRNPRRLPNRIPTGMAIPETNRPSLRTSFFICLLVVPMTRSLPYSCVLATTEI